MNIRNMLLVCAFAALVTPMAALAQMGPPGGPPGPPSPEMRAQFEKTRAQYRTAALNELSADHRAKVQAILAQVQSGSLDPRDASTQIDAILTPSESQAVLTQAQKMHDAMRAQMANAGPPHHMNRKPDAGRFLMMLSMPAGPPPGQPRP